MAFQLQGKTAPDGTLNNVFVDSNHRLHTTSSNKITLVITKLLQPSDPITDSIDITGCQSIRIYGTNSVGKNIHIEYGNTNSNWISCDELLTITHDSSHTYNKLISTPPNYIRFKNNHSSNMTVTMHVVKIF